MEQHPAPDDRWRCVAPADATWWATGRRRTGPSAPHLASGAPVAVWASGPFASRRLRRAAVIDDLHLERRYLGLPTLHHPIVLVEDRSAAFTYFRTKVLTVPPSRLPATLLALLVGVVRHVPDRLVRRLLPGRVAVGYRR
jgi:hypothetical protein